MSKVDPEVGDVWKRKGSTSRFTFLTAISGNMPWVYFLETDLTEDYYDLDNFLKNFEYVGKAKGSIEDLFKAERNETRDGIDLYGNGSLYIKREALKSTLPFGKAEEEFQKQIEEYAQSKKSFNERKEIPLSLEEKLDIAVKALQYYADDLNWSDCTSYGYKQRRYRKIVSPLSFFEKNGFKTAQEALVKIKEIKQ